MFDLMLVYEAIERSRMYKAPADDQDSLISLLIYNVFGGDILKTHRKRGWHFYNRIDGLRIDFTRGALGKSMREKKFEDIPATPDEPAACFEKEQYSAFFMSFVRSFEELVGLRSYQQGYAY